MGEVINLRQVRKARAKAKAAAEAAQRRIDFGLSKPEKQVSRLQTDMDRHKLDARRIQSDKTNQGEDEK